MSNEAITAVLRHSKATNSDRLVLIVLANIADHEATTYPGISYVCRSTLLSERTIQGSIRRLEAMGEIAVTVGGGRGKRTGYEILLPDAKGAHSAGYSKPKTPQIAAENPADFSEETPQIFPKNGATPLKNTNNVNTKGHTSVNVARETTTSQLWERRKAIFDAYCDGLGIRPDSAEAESRRQLAYGALTDAVTPAVDLATFAEQAHYVAARFRAGGIRQLPKLERVLEAETEFRRWVADGRPGFDRPAAVDKQGRRLLSSADILTGANGHHGGTNGHHDSGSLRALAAARGIPERTDR